MMEINLRLYAGLDKYLPDSGDFFTVPRGCDVFTIIRDLGIPREEIRLIFINGRSCSGDTRLNPGDRLGIFPPVGGG